MLSYQLSVDIVQKRKAFVALHSPTASFITSRDLSIRREYAVEDLGVDFVMPTDTSHYDSKHFLPATAVEYKGNQYRYYRSTFETDYDTCEGMVIYSPLVLRSPSAKASRSMANMDGMWARRYAIHDCTAGF